LPDTVRRDDAFEDRNVRGALDAGLTRSKIAEAFTHLADYAGFPAGFSALTIAKEVFAPIDAEAKS